MTEMCSDCGLPTELCVCTDFERGTVEISVEQRRYNKCMTIVSGVLESDVDELSTELKSAVGAGGTTKSEEIHVQGDHQNRQSFVEKIESYGYEVKLM